MAQPHTPTEIFSNPAYVGKHVVLLDSEVHVAATGEEAARIIEELRQKYPDKQPILTYIPSEDSLVLVVWR